MFVIAGVSGHVGAVVASELLDKKQKIKVIVRDAKKGAEWSKRGAEVAVGSLEDGAFLAGALKGATGFFTLLPPNFGVSSADEMYGWQRKTGETIAAAVKQAGVPHVVFLSSIGAHLDKNNGPIKGLHHFENALRASGTKLTAIRAGYFQENLGQLIAPARAGMLPNFYPTQEIAIPMIATVDIGHLAAESLLKQPAKSEIVDLVGPAYTIRQLAEKLGKALGKNLQIVDIPVAQQVGALQQGGLPQYLAEIFFEMYEGFRSGVMQPVGDRLVQGSTEIDPVIAKLTA
jgi:uncharacterized protein YbjT (DUF2867 family)